jgi:hypothetical protein
LSLLPQEAADKQKQTELASALLAVSSERITSVDVLKRSIDARSRQVRIRLSVDVYIDEPSPLRKIFPPVFFSAVMYPSHLACFIGGCGSCRNVCCAATDRARPEPVILEREKTFEAGAGTSLFLTNPE